MNNKLTETECKSLIPLITNETNRLRRVTSVVTDDITNEIANIKLLIKNSLLCITKLYVEPEHLTKEEKIYILSLVWKNIDLLKANESFLRKQGLNNLASRVHKNYKSRLLTYAKLEAQLGKKIFQVALSKIDES